MYMYICRAKRRMTWWKVKGSITICTVVRSDRKKERGRIDTYLETIPNKFS